MKEHPKFGRLRGKVNAKISFFGLIPVLCAISATVVIGYLLIVATILSFKPIEPPKEHIPIWFLITMYILMIPFICMSYYFIAKIFRYKIEVFETGVIYRTILRSYSVPYDQIEVVSDSYGTIKVGHGYWLTLKSTSPYGRKGLNINDSVFYGSIGYVDCINYMIDIVNK